jgi:hypothetical protein
VFAVLFRLARQQEQILCLPQIKRETRPGRTWVLAGACIALVSILMAAILLVAIFTVHLPNGFNSIKLLAVTDGVARFGQPGYEADLLYLGRASPHSCWEAPGRFRSTGCLRSMSLEILSRQR